MKTIVKIVFIIVLFPILSFGYNDDNHAYNKEKLFQKPMLSTMMRKLT